MPTFYLLDLHDLCVTLSALGRFPVKALYNVHNNFNFCHPHRTLAHTYIVVFKFDIQKVKIHNVLLPCYL